MMGGPASNKIAGVTKVAHQLMISDRWMDVFNTYGYYKGAGSNRPTHQVESARKILYGVAAQIQEEIM